MTFTAKLIAATALVASFAAPAFAAEPLSQQLEERNTFTNPAPGGWSANAMASRMNRAPMHMTAPVWRGSANVSPASMASGLEQQR